MNNLKGIGTGTRVAVIGGGPAGSFFALYLRRYAQERGIEPDITIYQERNFQELGPKGCKGCAGLLSISLMTNLRELGLTVPPDVVQSRISNYAVHSPYTSIVFSKSEKEPQILSVYRGGGPSASHSQNVSSFDSWLLGEARMQGVKLEYAKVSGVSISRVPRIQTGDREIEFDLVVLATGVNSPPVKISGVDYIRPGTRLMAQGELYADEEQVKKYLGDIAHAFLIPHSNLVFGTLVPKGAFINVSVLNNSNRFVSITNFLSYQIVKERLPAHYEFACRCQPRTLVKPARNFYADRFVAIGDAAVSRLYKDGIGSSLLAAREAARTVLYHGLSRRDFKKYYQPFCSRVTADNRWGKFLFMLSNVTKNSRLFLLTQHRLIGNEQHLDSSSRLFSRAGWGMFTGNYMYASIAGMALRPGSLLRFISAFLAETLSSAFHAETQPRSLNISPRKVLILGSGFGGTYVLRHLVPSLNRNENVDITMVSNENFFLFTPLLHEVAMGGIETRHVAYPIRRLHWRDRFNFIHANVLKIDLAKHTVLTTRGALDFDYLVLALGSVNLPPAFAGTDNAGILFTLKSLLDALRIRNHIISVFEQASAETNPERVKQLLTFVVSGAGYTGIQIVTELRDFIHKTLTRFYKTIDTSLIKIILVEVEPRIVAEMDTKLGEYTMNYLLQTGIDIRLKSKVTQIAEGRVEINGEEMIPAETLIWATGVVANPLISELEPARDQFGRILVNQYLEVPGHPEVYAIGDCAHFRDTRTGHVVPPRAHNAVRQAKTAACNILAEIRGRGKKPYRYSNNAEMVSLGASKAVLRFHGFRLSGLPARLIWLGAYTLLVTGTYNRIRIVMDWVLSSIFGRDTTLLKLDEPDDTPGNSR